MWGRNTIVLLAAAAIFVALSALVSAGRHLFERFDPNYVLLAVFVCISVASFVILSGGFWTRTGLVVLLPALLGLVAELFNHDAAYQGLDIVLGAVGMVVSFLACVFIGGPIFLWRQHKQGAT
jgi:hypothetical protein